MPLTPEQKRQKVIAAGLDPNEYTWEDTGEDFSVPDESSAAVVAPPSVSAGDAFWSKLKRAAIPGAAALPAMGFGAKAGAALGSVGGPIGSGVGAIVGGIGAGIGANYLTSRAQEGVLEAVQSPENYQAGLKHLQEAERDQPIASILGDLAPQALGFKPSMNLLRAGNSALLGTRPTVAAKEAAKIAAINAGVGGGVDIAQQSALNEDGHGIDLRRAGLSALAGGLLAEPNRIGRRFFPGGSAVTLPEKPAKVDKVETVKSEAAPKDVITENILAQTPEEIRAELQGKEVKPSLVNDQNPVVKSGLSEKRPNIEEGINDDPTMQFFQADGVTLRPGLTPEQLTKAREYAAKRGVTLETPETITGPEGQPARGFSVPGERRAALSNTATADTPYHEIGGHQFADDLAKSASAKDRKIIAEAQRYAGSPEDLAEFVGRRLIEVEGAPVRSWMQDLAANVRRMTNTGDEMSTQRHFARRAKDDRPYSESPELQTKVSGVVSDKTPGGKLFSPEGSGPADPEQSRGFAPFLQSEVDKLKSSSNPSDKRAARAAEEFYTAQREYLGKFQDKIDQIIAKAENPEAVGQWLWENRFNRGKPTVMLTPQDQAIVDALRPELVEIHNEQRRIGRLVEGEREAQDNPYYSPTVVSQDVVRVFSEGKNKPLIEKLKADYIEHQYRHAGSIAKLPPIERRAEARKMLDNYLRNLHSPQTKGSPEFGAVNTKAGSGLPYSWTEKDPRSLFRRYTERIARDFAFHKAVLSDEDTKVIFDYRDRYGKASENPKNIPPSTNPALQTVYRQMAGDFPSKNATYQATESLIRSGLLGTLTGASNHIAGYGQALVYVPAKDIPKILTSWKNISSGMADSFKQGVNRRTTLDLEVKDVGPGYWSDKIRTLANSLRKWQGANTIEQFSRGHHMALGEMVAQSAWGRALAGKANVEDMRFLQKFGPEEVDFKNTPITQEAVEKIAAKFVERIQGTYDARGLPATLLEPTTPYYWLFNLSKWSVERSNIVKQDVINPLLKSGDWGPLLKFTLGATLSGAAIGELREMLNNRKAPTPDFKELEEKGGPTDWAHKFFELQKLSGAAGIVGDFIHLVSAKSKGYSTPEIGVPSVDVIKDTAKGTADMIEAINAGQAPLETFRQWALDTIVNNIQAARLAMANTTKAQELEDADKRRDLRVYKQLDGQDVPAPMGGDVNQYLDKDAKEFKRSKDLEEAKGILKEKILPRLEGEEKETRRDKLSSLRKNSYQTVPSDRREAKAYLDYLSKTQGGEIALERGQDKRVQDLLNRRKSRLVPRQ